MPITIDETYRSREGSEGEQPAAELRYVIQGTDNDTTVRALLEATSRPLTWASNATKSLSNHSAVTYGTAQHAIRSRKKHSLPSTPAVALSTLRRV